jgi:hypothetical protein
MEPRGSCRVDDLGEVSSSFASQPLQQHLDGLGRPFPRFADVRAVDVRVSGGLRVHLDVEDLRSVE